jgi:hypothetical protein
MTTKKQAIANRRNALKSTGPTTPKGKEVVRFNALTHGLLSKEVVIPVGEGKENEGEFRALLTQLREDLTPEGVLEEMLVERIAVCYWRLKRAVRCETGEIRTQLDTLGYQEVMARTDEFNAEKKWLILDESRDKISKNSVGVGYLISVLDEVKADVEETGHLSGFGVKKLISNFGAEEDSLASVCCVVSEMATQGPEKAKEDPEKYGDTPPPEKCKEAILKLIEQERARLVTIKEILEEKENAETAAKIPSLALPSKEAMEKILRYETTIERQLYRAINELERLQRFRQVEGVLPAFGAWLSGGG